MSGAKTRDDLDRLRGMSVLLAEDNVTNQLVATQMLENLGANVDVASDGAIALERLAENSYDILLVDIEMPRVSGLDVIRSVRSSDGELANAPVIALTAYAMQEHREKIRQAGADGLIPKPIISIEQFGSDILTYIDDGAARRSTSAAAGLAGDGPQIEMEIFDSLAETIGGDAMQDLLSKIEVDLTDVREQIVQSTRSRDEEMMRASTHVLISVAGAVGAVRLQGQAEKLNALANQGDFGLIENLSSDTVTELDGVMGFITTKLSEGAG
ncbi:MAG: response regulator [Pseudomonadota bacterium]